MGNCRDDRFSFDRHKDDSIPEFELKEDDIVRATRVILPAANAAIAVTRELFSGEPSMTLKVNTSSPFFPLSGISCLCGQSNT